MDTLQITSLIASFLALGIGVMAIWLSVVFYKMTSKVSESTREAAKDISASVNQLEKVFDTLYSDTFSMMRDTVTDMRKHMWPEKTEASEKIGEEAEKRADAKVKVLKKEVDSEVTKLLEIQSKTDAKVESLKGDLEKIVDRVITQSRKVEIEARRETLKEHVIREAQSLYRHGRSFKAAALVDRVREKFPEVPSSRTVNEVEKLKEEGVLHWEDERLGPNTVITM